MAIDSLANKVKRNPKVSISIIFIIVLIIIGILVTVVVILPKPQNDEDSNGNKDKKGDKDQLDSEYFDRSILRLTKDSQMTIESKISVFSIENQNGKPKKEVMDMIEGAYNFKTQNEKASLKYYKAGSQVGSNDLLGIDNLDEIYEIDYNLSTCNSFDDFKEMMKSYLSRWFPVEFLKFNLESKILSE